MRARSGPPTGIYEAVGVDARRCGKRVDQVSGMARSSGLRKERKAVVRSYQRRRHEIAHLGDHLIDTTTQGASPQFSLVTESARRGEESSHDAPSRSTPGTSLLPVGADRSHASGDVKDNTQLYHTTCNTLFDNVSPPQQAQLTEPSMLWDFFGSYPDAVDEPWDQPWDSSECGNQARFSTI